MSDELRELLQTQQAVGTHDSTDSFTLDHVKAREKLAKYQLGESGLWLVKALQAAVASGAPEFRVKFSRRKVSVTFAPQTTWDASHLLELSLSGASVADRALSHLVTAIRSCLSEKDESVEWSVGGQKVKIDRRGTRFFPSNASQDFLLEATRPPSRLPWLSLLVCPLEYIFKQITQDWRTLVSRCWASPIPVIVDGKALRTGYDAIPHVVLNRFVHRRRTSLNVCLGACPLFATTSRPELTPSSSWPTDNEINVVRGPHFLGTFLRWNRPGPTPRGFLSLHACVIVGPTVDFVLDGAIVESRVIKPIAEQASSRNLLNRALLMPRFLFAVEPHEVDLGGFSVRGVDELELYQQSKNEAKELLNMIISRFSEYRVRAGDERSLLNKGIRDLAEFLGD